MGFLDFFNSIFGGTKCRFKPEELDINVTDDAFVINGNRLEVPCHLNSLIALFGKPRKTSSTNNSNINYTWDELGLYCYTKGNNVVYCFAIMQRVGELSLKYLPKATFAGRLNVLGKPWEEAMSLGTDEEGFARSLLLNSFSLFAEYKDFDKGDTEGFGGAYATMEISLRDK